MLSQILHKKLQSNYVDVRIESFIYKIHQISLANSFYDWTSADELIKKSFLVELSKHFPAHGKSMPNFIYWEKYNGIGFSFDASLLRSISENMLTPKILEASLGYKLRIGYSDVATHTENMKVIPITFFMDI